MLIQSFWNRFLNKVKLDEGVKYTTVFHFELTEKLANELLALVFKGQKKATASSLNSYEIENEDLPKVGDYNIVTSWDGIPRCVIKTTEVTLVPFKDMTYELCSKEGEDDNLESWREGTMRFFIAEGKEMGYQFTEDLVVVFEEFAVVYQE